MGPDAFIYILLIIFSFVAILSGASEIIVLLLALTIIVGYLVTKLINAKIEECKLRREHNRLRIELGVPILRKYKEIFEKINLETKDEKK